MTSKTLNMSASTLRKPFRALQPRHAVADMAPVLLIQGVTLLAVAVSASTIFSIAWMAAAAFERLLVS